MYKYIYVLIYIQYIYICVYNTCIYNVLYGICCQVTGYVLITVVHASVIPLTNLRLIRGYTTFLDPHNKENSLYVAANYKHSNMPNEVGLRELQMPSLSGQWNLVDAV